MKKIIITSVITIILFITIMVLLYEVYPPGTSPVHENKHKVNSYTAPLILSQGSLPGITWIDDVQPNFISNRCGQKK